MKVKSRQACLSAAVVAVLYGIPVAHARDLTWDSSGTGATAATPGPVDGSGTWDTSNTNWYDPTGPSNVTWSNANPDSAIFGTGTTSTPGNGKLDSVTLGQSITVQNITLGTASDGAFYSIFDQGDGGQTLTLAGNVTKTAALGGSEFQLANKIVLTGGNHLFALNDTPGDAAPEMQIDGGFTGSGSITLDNGTAPQWGSLAFVADSNYTGGTNINKGRLEITTAGGLGTGTATIGAQGALSIGGSSTKTAGSLNITTPITITRNTYAGTDFNDYPDAIISDNPGNVGKTVTFSGPFTVDSTDARVAARSSTIVIPNPLIAGPTVGAGNAVFTADGDFAGFITLSGDNTAFSAAGNTIKIIGGVEVNAASEANLGGATSKLNLSGGTIHPTGSLLTSGFMTNFGAHDLSAAPVNTGVDLDAGNVFTVNNFSGGAIGTRGAGTINFNGTNTFTGRPFFDGGTVNINNNITFGGFALRSPTVNIAPAVTLISATSGANEAIVVAFDGHDTSTLNIGGNLTLSNAGGLAIGDGASANGTVNNAGTITVGNEMWVGNGGGTGTFTQTAGSTTVNNWFAIGRDVNGATGATGTVTLSGGTITKQGNGHAYLGEATRGSGTMTISNTGVFNEANGEFWVGQGGGTGVLNIGTAAGAATNADALASFTNNTWFAVGRNGGTGTVNLYDGTLTQQTRDHFDVGAGGTGTVNVFGGTLNGINAFLGEIGNGSATLNVSGGTVNLTGNTIFANGDSVTGTINLNGGTLNAQGFTANNGGGTGKATFKFNGGTLVASADVANFIGAKVTSVVSTGGANISPGGHTITVNSALTHDATLAGADGGLAVSGTGNITLGGVETYNGPTSVSGGALLTVASTSSINTAALNSTTLLTNNGTVTTNGGGSVDSIAGTGTLNVAGGTLALTNPTLGTLNTQNALSLSGTGKLDIQKNQIQVSGNQYSPLVTAFTGGQLISSAITSANSSTRAVGIAYNSSANTTTARYTTYGDANLDGKFNGADVAQINGANNFGGPVGSATWSTGDTNYDGKFNGIDVAKINGANSFGTGTITSSLPSGVTSSAIAQTGGNSTIDLQYDPATGNLKVVTNGIGYGTITLSASSSVFKDGVAGTSPEYYSDDSGNGTSLFFGVLAGQQTSDVLLPGVLDPNQSLATLLNAITVASDTNGPALSQITFSSTGASVPEPTSLGLLALAAGGLMRRRRRN